MITASDDHEIIAAELSLSNVTDAEVLTNLFKQTRRKIIEISVMVLMTQDIAMMQYEYSERFRSSHHERGRPFGNGDILAI